MSTIDFWRLQKAANLTNKQAAEFIGVNVRQVERWRVDNPPAPKAAIKLLGYYIKFGELGYEKSN